VFVVISALRVAQAFGVGKYSYEVREVKALNDRVTQLSFRPLGRGVKASMGQYISLQVDLLGEAHPFSVVSYDDNGDISISFKVFGKFTERLQSLKTGARVFVDGTYGVFTQELTDQPERPACFLAGGIGITPFVQRTHQEGATHERYLISCNRFRSDAVYGSLLKPVLGKRYCEVLSDEKELLPGEVGGFFREEVLRSVVGDPLHIDYFICGPPPMMKAAKKVLAACGVPRKQIHLEEFGY
jgi:predicted ferric reductase